MPVDTDGYIVITALPTVSKDDCEVMDHYNVIKPGTEEGIDAPNRGNEETISSDQEVQDPYHNSDDETLDPDYKPKNESKSKDEYAVDDNETTNPPALAPKKRKRGEFNKRAIAKKMRNMGEEYESTSGKKVNKRCIKPPCKNCKFKCNEKIDDNYRKEQFNLFWSMGDLQRQREFIKDSTKTVTPQYQRITLNRHRVRGHNQAYYITKEGKQIRVCKLFFRNTFDLSERAIYTTFQKTDKNTAVLDLEMRGKHGKGVKLDEELVKSAKEHIQKIPKIPSHYTRADTTRQYIDGGKSVADLHRDYINERKEANLKGVSYGQYLAIFNSFNISFFRPKKDQCEDCLTFNETKENATEYETHILEKDLSRIEKEEDKLKTDSSTIVAVYDLQAVLPCPKGEASSFYYISKLAFYNFTIVELKGDKNVHCYTWDESQGHRGANEIATCVLSYLTMLNENAEGLINVIFYSDNCCGQQKNQSMINMYKLAVNTLKNVHTITHKFLVKGHTQNEGDSAHSIIEKAVKRALLSGPIFVPSQYAMIIKTAKKTGKPYYVHEQSFKDFKDFKVLKYYVIKRLAEVRIIKVEKDEEAIFYKTSYGQQDWDKFQKRVSRNKDLNELLPAYHSRIPIEEKKKKGILDLVKKGIIPNVHFDFFNSL